MFVVLGAGAAAVGSVVDKTTQTKIAGFVLVVIGLAFLGLLPWPERAVAPGLLQRARRRGSSALLGGAFAVCAAPCIGTVLASILVLARARAARSRAAIVLLLAYSLGLGAAFVLAGVAFAHAMRAFRWVRDHYAGVRVASGVDARRARAAALLPPGLVAAHRARPAVHAGSGSARSSAASSARRRRGRGGPARRPRAAAAPSRAAARRATGLPRPRW